MISFSFFGGLILFPIYMQELRGLSAFAAVLAAIVGGSLVDRFEPRLMLMDLSTWQLAGVTLTTSYPWLILVMAVRGLGPGCLVQISLPG